jgi:hypothetical protein
LSSERTQHVSLEHHHHHTGPHHDRKHTTKPPTADRSSSPAESQGPGLGHQQRNKRGGGANAIRRDREGAQQRAPPPSLTTPSRPRLPRAAALQGSARLAPEPHRRCGTPLPQQLPASGLLQPRRARKSSLRRGHRPSTDGLASPEGLDVQRLRRGDDGRRPLREKSFRRRRCRRSNLSRSSLDLDAA